MYVVNNVILVFSSGFEFLACSVCVYISIEKKKKRRIKNPTVVVIYIQFMNTYYRT